MKNYKNFLNEDNHEKYLDFSGMSNAELVEKLNDLFTNVSDDVDFSYKKMSMSAKYQADQIYDNGSSRDTIDNVDESEGELSFQSVIIDAGEEDPDTNEYSDIDWDVYYDVDRSSKVLVHTSKGDIQINISE